jgi:eukaryotic-like serine/threonine-protein kinase
VILVSFGIASPERTGSTAILEGSIAALGSQYVLGLQAQNCNTGSILDREQAQAARREDVLNTLGQIAHKFRRRTGESLATVEKHSTHLWEATTSSLEALKAYSTAMKVLLSRGNEASNPLFQRAVELDPKFAMAYAHLGLNYAGGVGARPCEDDQRLAIARSRKRSREVLYRV